MRKVRAEKAGSQTRILAVALTAHVRVEYRLRALSADYHVPVAKPIEPAKPMAVPASLAGSNG